MKDAQKPDHASLSTIINRIKEGRYVIPDFQREFEWRPWDIRDLIKSIFLDYYIGSLLLWKGKKENFDALSCESIYGFQGSNQKPEYIVLDGQQRLTAMLYVFLAPDIPLPKRANRYLFYINVDKFMTEDYDQAFDYAWAKNHVNKILNDQENQYENHIFPLSVIGAGGWDLPNWVQGYEKYWAKKVSLAEDLGDDEALNSAVHFAKDATEFGEHLKGITEQYQITYIELDKELEIEKVCDIFTQINSRGIQLDVFDLFNAMLKPKNLQLKHMWREAEEQLDFVKSKKMNVYILQVMSILVQSYCSAKYLYYLLPGHEKHIRDKNGVRKTEVLVADTESFTGMWDNAVKSLVAAIKLLKHPQEFGAISSKYLPYVSILPAFSALQSHIKNLPANDQLTAQRKIRHWYWASVFTNRYSGSVESTSARDFLDVKEWISQDASEPSVLQEFKSNYKNIELRKETKSGTSIYSGIFNLLVLQGARDWMTGNVPQHDDLDDHHIVPAAWGKKHLKGNEINTILNRTPITSDTNRKIIGSKLPNEYLPELIETNGESTVRNILESHFISPEAQTILLRKPFTPADFDAFIKVRQRTIQDAIENLLIKERLDLAPHLRDFDAQIELVELQIRSLIASTLDKHNEVVPSHIELSAKERIERASKKNAAMETEKYETLEGILEFCDLRELQNIITSKSLWTIFSDIFTNKETLNSKFSQLAELRNGIRHSRDVDVITRKEGEASILWFEKVLS